MDTLQEQTFVKWTPDEVAGAIEGINMIHGRNADLQGRVMLASDQNPSLWERETTHDIKNALIILKLPDRPDVKGAIHAQKVPGGSILEAHARPECWPQLKPVWVSFLQELRRQEKIKRQQAKGTRGPNDETEIKIEKLKAYRLQELQRTGKIPDLATACGSIVPTITSKTVKTNAPELYKNWRVREFR